MFKVQKFTNVTNGGTPGIGDLPTTGLLKDLITKIVNLSDTLALEKSKLDRLSDLKYPGKKEDFLAMELEQVLLYMMKLLDTYKYKIKQVNYGNYHATEMPNELK